MSRTVWVILAILALAFAVITGLAVQRGVLGAQSQSAAIGGPFHLVDQTGAARDAGLLKKKWSAVFFGFTYCPEACPTTLLALGQTEKLLGPKADDFQTVFISVDPGRDTPKVLANYLSNSAFPRHTVGLTGADSQVAEAAHAYRVFYQKAGDGPDYQINHSTITYLMNPTGDFVCVLPYGETPQAMAGQIEAAMKLGPHAQSCRA
ncbi:SCO family protein [Phenylobacterium sp.]|uniref:SCO family protein n=1 Tax=Phenylobacterium sp. TaxID=1871053 RepID=UPI0011FA797C|nr:SCO family protein [Phenylobacterium sp.]THD62436.1 MAG: SCO family protein [Phenylobacterium sp.]